jgi:hypothetical protein
MDDVIIVGAGIGGLTLGLALHAAGIPCRIFESAAEIKAVGVGINLLPHATKELAALGLEPALAKVAIATGDATFFNRFGQLIYQEPLGRALLRPARQRRRQRLKFQVVELRRGIGLSAGRQGGANGNVFRQIAPATPPTAGLTVVSLFVFHCGNRINKECREGTWTTSSSSAPALAD